jgi:hypothetical protein
MANGLEAHMVTWCGRLVIIDEETRTVVHFAHPTVKQYLRSDNAEAATRAAVERFLVRRDEADTEVGEVCVTYLCFSDFDQRLVKMSRLDLSIDPASLASTSLAASGSASIARGLDRLGRWCKKRPMPATKLDSLVSADDCLRFDRAQATRHPFVFQAYASENWIAHTSRLTERVQAWHGFLRLVLEVDHFAGLRRRLESGHDKKLACAPYRGAQPVGSAVGSPARRPAVGSGTARRHLPSMLREAPPESRNGLLGHC